MPCHGTAPLATVTDHVDNALPESGFPPYKAELITMQGPWRTVDDVELATLSRST
jgi:putative transposase